MDSKKRKIKIGIIIGGSITAVLLLAAVGIFCLRILFGDGKKEFYGTQYYDDLKDYEYFNTAFMTFPENLSEDLEAVEFYYIRQDFLVGRPCYEVFLQCTYTPEEYEAEVERLNHTRKVFEYTRECTLLRDEEGRFAYPAYIAIDNHFHSYEYALLTGDNQITYIATSIFGADDLHFDTDYLPSDYMCEPKEDFFGSGYCIYIKERTEDVVDYDYTRDEIVPIRDVHSEQKDDNYFYVDTIVQEDGKEVITECEYYVWENVNQWAGEPEITVYPQLNGYEFRKLSLNRERTSAVITYFDGQSERELEIELPEQ